MPELRVQRYTLANGLRLLVVERHALPVVDARLVVRAGAAADPPETAGRAALVAEMLDEGSRDRGVLQIADDVEHLGAELVPQVSWDAALVDLHVLAPRLEPALALMAEVAVRPAFPADELRRVKEELRARLLQEQVEPATLAAKAFAAALYGRDHPYGRPLAGTARTVEPLERPDLVAFFDERYGPEQAWLVVVGDVAPDTLLPALERAFGEWRTPASPPPELPPPPARAPTAARLVHKPGAAQSELRIGHVGVPRTTDDYFPLVVLNTILGGSFTSRLNMKLREERGYTYGARSGWDWRFGAGPFVTATAVHTDATAGAVLDILAELRRLQDERVPDEELDRARNYLALGLPRRFETTGDLAGHVTDLALYGLPDDYYDRFVERVRAVTAEDVLAAARRHLDPDHAAIVVSGDVPAIEPALTGAGVGEVSVVEVEL